MIKRFYNKAKKTLKKLLSPILYSYIGYIVFDFIKRLKGYKEEKQYVFNAIGYYPDLKNPQSFNEKILWKKIHDRNPLLPIVSDKYRVREYIIDILGRKEAEKILIPMLYVTDKPESIPFDELPVEYFIKPNHASQRYVIAENIEKQKKYTIIHGIKTNILYDCMAARKGIINVCKGWLSKPYSRHRHEWAYQKIKRKILIEKLLRNSSGKLAYDYKFIVFHGKCHFISVWYDRFVDLNGAFYTSEWKYLNIRGYNRQAGYQKKPENLKSMIDIAELLGKPFDFIRVDLYLVDDRIYFGELTSYPLSGTNSYDPQSFDFELGAKWKLIPRYWKK